MKRVILTLIYCLYRQMTAILDFRGHMRAVKGEPRFDVAFITNFENEDQRTFMGFFPKDFNYGPRFYLNGVIARFMPINNTSRGLSRQSPETREVGKRQVKAAIKAASDEGVRVILFGASTKRLLEKEIDEIQKCYPHITFSIGDNGTAWVLVQEVFESIRKRGLNFRSKIMVIGPRGHLGSTVIKALSKAGFSNLVPVSSANEEPFKGTENVELIVACSHNSKVKLSAEILKDVYHKDGVYVIDVCRPYNLSKREFRNCVNSNIPVERQDAGIAFNAGIEYVFLPGAWVALRQLELSFKRLYGCFSEASALASVGREILIGEDFMCINKSAMKVVEAVFEKQNFSSSPVTNFGQECEEKGKRGENTKHRFQIPRLAKNLHLLL